MLAEAEQAARVAANAAMKAKQQVSLRKKELLDALVKKCVCMGFDETLIVKPLFYDSEVQELVRNNLENNTMIEDMSTDDKESLILKLMASMSAQESSRVLKTVSPRVRTLSGKESAGRELLKGCSKEQRRKLIKSMSMSDGAYDSDESKYSVELEDMAKRAVRVPPSTGKVVLITGGAGFIGSHVAEVCLARGDRVVVVDEMNDYYDIAIKKQNVLLLESMNKSLAVYIGDIL